MTGSWPERSAYLRPGVLERWDDSELSAWASRASDAGVTAAVTKLDVITPQRRALLERRGLTMIGSFSCYSDHRHPGALPGGVRPVGRDGRPLELMEWYTGLVPGSAQYDDALEEQLASQTRAAQAEWVVLDFLRWPGHWELESRGDASPRESSFDPLTLTRFAIELGVRTATVSDVDENRQAWHHFRTRTITERAGRFASTIRDAGSRPGMFLVPVEHERRRLDYGQDAAALAAHVEMLALMTYQQMVGLTGDDVLALADEVSALSARPVVTMLQTTSASEYAGPWNWGPEITASELSDLATRLDNAARSGRNAGTCFFPGEAPIPNRETPRGHS